MKSPLPDNKNKACPYCKINFKEEPWAAVEQPNIVCLNCRNFYLIYLNGGTRVTKDKYGMNHHERIYGTNETDGVGGARNKFRGTQSNEAKYAPGSYAIGNNVGKVAYMEIK